MRCMPFAFCKRLGPAQLKGRHKASMIWHLCDNQVGDLIWRNKDPGLEARARGSYEGLSAAAKRKLPVHVSVIGRLGEVCACCHVFPVLCR